MTEKEGSASTSLHEQGNVSLQCPKLKETNYTQWAVMMETILKAYSLWETVVSMEGINEKKAHTTKALIFQTLPEDVLMQVAQYEKAKEVWDAIKVRYLGADMVQKARLQTLRSELEVLKIDENDTVSSFASKLSGIKAKFKTLGTTIKDKKLVRKLLISVPKKFLPIVANIEQYSEIDKMPFEEAVGRIIAFEERLKSQDKQEDNNQGGLMMAHADNQFESLHHGKGRGVQNYGRSQGQGSFKGGRGRGKDMGPRNQDKSKFRCYDCGELGHFARDCTKWKEKEKDTQQEANLALEEEPMLLQVKQVEDLH